MREIRALQELEMLSPWFDASAPALAVGQAPGGANGPGRLLLVLAPPRSGSYHLCRLLWHLGYGKPAEYFNPHLHHGWRRFEPRPGPLQRLRRRLDPRQVSRPWLEQLVRERSACSELTGHPFFAAKLQAHQLGEVEEALQRHFAPLARRGAWPEFSRESPALVLLYRRDWRRALLSYHLALCSGAFDEGRLFSFQLRPLSALGQRGPLLEDLATYRSHLEWLGRAADCIPCPLQRLSFEDLLHDQERSLISLIRGIEPQPPSEALLTAHPALQVRVGRTPDPWEGERAAWLQHLQERFTAEGLREHPDARACAAQLARLEAANPRKR